MDSGGVDLEELRGSLRDLLAGESDPRAMIAAADRGQTVGRALWAKLAELGWLGLSIGEAHSGMGLSFGAAGVLYEELGRALAPVPVLGSLLAAQALERAGSAEQKARWLPRLAAGEVSAAIGLPFGLGAGLPERTSGGTVSGMVPHLLYADAADLLLAPAMGSDGAIGLVLLTPDDPASRSSRGRPST